MISCTIKHNRPLMDSPTKIPPPFFLRCSPWNWCGEADNIKSKGIRSPTYSQREEQLRPVPIILLFFFFSVSIILFHASSQFSKKMLSFFSLKSTPSCRHVWSAIRVKNHMSDYCSGTFLKLYRWRLQVSGCYCGETAQRCSPQPLPKPLTSHN